MQRGKSAILRHVPDAVYIDEYSKKNTLIKILLSCSDTFRTCLDLSTGSAAPDGSPLSEAVSVVVTEISFFHEDNNFQIIFSTENGSKILMKINLLGNNIITKNVGSIAGWHKLYIVWGDDIKNGYDFILFIDNAEIAVIDNDTLPDFIGTNTFKFTISESVIARGKRKCKNYIIYKDCHNIRYTTYSQASLKEIKIWDKAYSLDPQSVY